MMSPPILVFWIVSLSSAIFAMPPYNDDFMEDMCTGDITEAVLDLTKETSSYGFLKVVKDGKYYPANFTCKVHIIPHPSYHIGIRIRWVDIYSTDRDCRQDRMILQGNSSGSDTFVFCGSGAHNGYYSADTTGEVTAITFQSTNHNTHSYRGFELYYTSFHKGACSGDEYRCKQYQYCIPRAVTCDSLGNCPGWEDERVSTCGMSTGGIISITIISAFLLGMCVIAIIYSVKGRGSNRRRRQTASAGHQATANGPTVVYNRSRSSRSEDRVEPPPPYLFYDEKTPLPAYDNPAYTPGALPPMYDEITQQAFVSTTLYPEENTSNPTPTAVDAPSDPTTGPVSGDTPGDVVPDTTGNVSGTAAFSLLVPTSDNAQESNNAEVTQSQDTPLAPENHAPVFTLPTSGPQNQSPC